MQRKVSSFWAEHKGGALKGDPVSRIYEMFHLSSGYTGWTPQKFSCLGGMLARGGSTGSQQDGAWILPSAQFPCSEPSCPGARASHGPLSWSKKRCCGCAQVDAVALSSLLLRATRSLISIPFEPFQLPHPCNFSTPAASPHLQLHQ